MTNISGFLGGNSKSPQTNGPGSNGYFRRIVYNKAGSYSHTATKTGWHKFDLVGAGGGGSGDQSSYAKGGCGGGRSIKEIYLYKGDVVLIVICAGGVGSTTIGGDGGSSTVNCAARSLSLTCTGGDGGSSTPSAGVGTGGDINLTGGGQPSGTNGNSAGAAAPSHLADAEDMVSHVSGGAGLGGVPSGSNSYAGASSHNIPTGRSKNGANGLTAKGGELRQTTDPNTGNSQHGESKPFWDLADVDGGGGAYSEVSGSQGDGGCGAGGAGNISGSGSAGNGGILGGGGRSTGSSSFPGHGGNGAGGGGVAENTEGGDGGDGLLYLFFDELTPREAA